MILFGKRHSSGQAMAEMLVVAAVMMAILTSVVTLTASGAMQTTNAARLALPVRNLVYATAHFRYMEGRWPSNEQELRTAGYIASGEVQVTSGDFDTTAFSCQIDFDRVPKKVVNMVLQGMARMDNMQDVNEDATVMLAPPMNVTEAGQSMLNPSGNCPGGSVIMASGASPAGGTPLQWNNGVYKVVFDWNAEPGVTIRGTLEKTDGSASTTLFEADNAYQQIEGSENREGTWRFYLYKVGEAAPCASRGDFSLTIPRVMPNLTVTPVNPTVNVNTPFTFTWSKNDNATAINIRADFAGINATYPDSGSFVINATVPDNAVRTATATPVYADASLGPVRSVNINPGDPPLPKKPTITIAALNADKSGLNYNWAPGSTDAGATVSMRLQFRTNKPGVPTRYLTWEGGLSNDPVDLIPSWPNGMVPRQFNPIIPSADYRGYTWSVQAFGVNANGVLGPGSNVTNHLYSIPAPTITIAPAVADPNVPGTEGGRAFSAYWSANDPGAVAIRLKVIGGPAADIIRWVAANGTLQVGTVDLPVQRQNPTPMLYVDLLPRDDYLGFNWTVQAFPVYADGSVGPGSNTVTYLFSPI
jgi:hypothetical protein